MAFGGIKSRFSSYKFKRNWRKNNGHNQTSAGNIFNDKLVSVGKYTYGQLNVLTFDDKTKLSIGNFCSIGPNVWFIPSADHSLNHISTYPYKVNVLGEALEGVTKGDIIVEDDVWIGLGATILSGVRIGQGAVIAAGAVVSKNVPPYAIVAGTPAKTLKNRVSNDVISFLMTLDYKALDESMIKEHINDLYFDLDGLSLSEIESKFSWFPKK